MMILPSSSSISLESVCAIVDLPAPVLPHMPIFCPYSISNDSSLRTIGVFGLYLSDTLSKVTLPEEGHVSSGTWPSALSCGISIDSCKRWTDVICV